MRNKIELQKCRDFGEVFNGIFEFIFQNLKSFFKFQLIIPLPLIFLGIGCFAFALFTITGGPSIIGTSTSSIFSPGSIAVLILGLLLILGGVALVVPIYFTQVKLYKEGKQFNNFNEVWPVAKTFIGKTIGVYLTLGLLFIISVIGVGFITSAIGAILPFSGLFGFLIYIAMFLAVAGLAPAVLPALFMENLSVIDAVARGLSIGKRSFWFFVGVGISMAIVIGIASFGINWAIEWILSIVADSLGQQIKILALLATIIPLTLLTILQHLFYHTTSVFLYFSAVEKYEAKGLNEKVNEIV